METTQPIHITTEDAREYRRFLAWRMYCQGYRQKDIADTLQVTQGAISQWIKRAKEQGVHSLQKRIAQGPQPRLSKEQLERLPDLLRQGAPAYGFRGEVWTRARVACVIKQEFGISYSHAHISKLLRQIRWTQQSPLPRATQRNEALIQNWKEDTLPELKKGRFEKGEPCCI
jgi:transposase